MRFRIQFEYIAIGNSTVICTFYNNNPLEVLLKKTILFFLNIVLALPCLFIVGNCSAQSISNDFQNRNDAIVVTTLQDIQFGYFTQGLTGGTISVSADGTRSVSGSVIPLNFGNNYFQAIFEIEAPLGSIISMASGQNAILNGSNGGSMTLQIDNSIPATPFYTTVTPPAKTQVNVGATLTVGNSSTSPPGDYSGNVYVLFIVE